MIHALDYIALAARDLDSAAAGYALLLGCPAQRASSSDGAARATFPLGNMSLQLRAAPSGAVEGLAVLGFATVDLGKARSLLERRGLAVAQGDGGGSIDVAPAATHGTGISLVERAPGPAQTGPLPPADAEHDEIVSGLDHVVIRSPNPERAVALFAGRLGLSLRLDRTEPAWGARLLFFRCGDLVVEVAHDLKAGVSDGPDRLWGLSWRVADIGKAHARLRAAGIDISDIRAGRRPQTKVFTVKSHTAGVPTLMIGTAMSSAHPPADT